MSDHPAFEFDIVVRVRKRVWLSGPTDREVARDLVKKILQGSLSVGTIAKRGNDGHPIETILDNDFEVEDPT